MKNIFIIAFVLHATAVLSQNSYPTSGAAVLNSGVNGDDRSLVLKDIRSGTNWNYIEWQFNDGSRDWLLGRHVTTGAFSLYRQGLNEVMTIENNGRVGFGTTSLRGRFDVDGPGDIYLADDVNTGTNQSVFLPGHIYIAPYNGGNVSYLQARRGDNSGITALQIRTHNNGVITEAMRIQPDGSVGVGIIPYAASKLHVYESGSSTQTWRGRIVASGNTQAVVMGEYDGKAFLGAHSPTLDSWTDLIMQMGGKIGIGTYTPSQKIEVAGNFLQNQENAAFGIDAQANARFGIIKQFGTYPAIASDATSPILFAQTNQTGIFTNISGATLTERMRIHTNGNVGIGTKNPDQKLTVKGKIHTEEVIVDLSVPAPDYVFEQNYPLTPLDEVQAYIAQHKHLPEVPSAKEMEKDGVKVGEMEMILLKKIEEITLHLIEMKNINDQQSQQMKKMQAELDEFKKK